MPDYPSPATWEYANNEQRARASRSFDAMRVRAVMAYSGPLFVDDIASARIQSSADVAKRLLILTAVVSKAEGKSVGESVEVTERLGLWSSVSPLEKEFLDDEQAMDDENQRYVWRLEAMWVLLWSLGLVDRLDWPNKMCDVARILKLVKAAGADDSFISRARLRSSSELLDAQDLIRRIHWAVRHACLRQRGMLPIDLDWSKKKKLFFTRASKLIRAYECAGVGIVEQRHHTLNWLVNYLDPANWDEVDTPT